MSLIDSSYFINDILIPTNTYTAVDLGTEITKYEREILIKLLGYELYKLVAAYENPGSDQRIIDLVEGKEYDLSGQTLKWNGLVNTETVSLIAYYVYFNYMRNRATITTGNGEGKLMYENAEAVNYNGKIVQAWNRLEELFGYPGQNIFYESAYNFLTFYQATYPEWIFSPIGNINIFGL